MSYDNIQLPFAKNNDDELITIDDIDNSNKNEIFSCPICDSQVKPRAIKSIDVTPHFYHIDASKCNQESVVHFWFKHKFLEKGDFFIINSDEEKRYVCKEIIPEQTYYVDGVPYRPDSTVTTECGSVIYFEWAFSNKKKVQDYLDIWMGLKNIVVEVDIKELMNKNEVPTFKALYYQGKCFNVKKSDLYYNTIGKYKEEKLQGKVDQELKERIKKLDWFWRDVLKYKKGEVDIEQMVFLIDGFIGEEKEIIDKILKKQSCSSIKNDYINYKRQLMINRAVKIIDEVKKIINEEYDEGYNKHIEIVSNSNNLLDIKIKCKTIEDDRMLSKYYDLNKYNDKIIIDEILTDIWIIDRYDLANKYNTYAYELHKLLFSNETINELKEKLKKRNIKLVISVPTIKPLRKNLNKETLNENVGIQIKILNGSELLFTFKIKHHKKESVDNIATNIVNKAENCLNNIVKLNNVDNIEQKIIKIINEYSDYNISATTKLVLYELNEELQILIVTEETNYIFYLNNSFVFDEDGTEIKYHSLEDLISFTYNKINSIIDELYTKRCIECGKHFKISKGEVKFFNEKGFSLPKRCKSCRDKRNKTK